VDRAPNCPTTPESTLHLRCVWVVGREAESVPVWGRNVVLPLPDVVYWLAVVQKQRFDTLVLFPLGPQKNLNPDCDLIAATGPIRSRKCLRMLFRHMNLLKKDWHGSN
jgi:hypothetical protein